MVWPTNIRTLSLLSPIINLIWAKKGNTPSTKQSVTSHFSSEEVELVP